MKTLIAIAALPVLAMTAPQAAFAGEASTARVAIHDLDLTSEAGQAEMEKRVRKAAYAVCKYEDDGQLREANAHFSCVRTALKKSEGQMATLVANARFGG
ncbi:UrcA family protein [Croceicoccus mobilis]|uniref:UrcA family protein n=1 Tax=Croceicoccus mobilis TaxID=1703339 RepID=A0A916YUH3_9SPHN|nr:UrcA family protein [Croceicoccus mobilis]GGD60304.1 hypothetical protein GCM10010990_07160 [Croceicoccus mobilis]